MEYGYDCKNVVLTIIFLKRKWIVLLVCSRDLWSLLVTLSRVVVHIMRFIEDQGSRISDRRKRGLTDIVLLFRLSIHLYFICTETWRLKNCCSWFYWTWLLFWELKMTASALIRNSKLERRCWWYLDDRKLEFSLSGFNSNAFDRNHHVHFLNCRTIRPGFIAIILSLC